MVAMDGSRLGLEGFVDGGSCACFNFTGRQYENVNLRKERAEFIIRTQTVFASLTESKKHHTIKFWFRTYII